jgi:deferrochelatase/peroxidase EfeB
VVSRHAAQALPGGRIHFGYRDSISQPRIRGMEAIEAWIPDLQPDCDPGEFLLGHDYLNQFGGNFLEDLPPELAANGSYGAFRIMAQDVYGFADYTQRISQRFRMGTPGSDEHPDMVAAKLMGRWPEGESLVVSPQCPRGIADAELNNFDYAPPPDQPAYFDDKLGLRCPIGSHVRRMNPRSAVVMGKPHTRRIIRRNLPYGPAIVPGARPDEVERGLIGYFVCGDLELQFEFLLKIWANMDIATAGLRGTRDPMIGAQDWLGETCPTDARGDWAGQYVIRTNDLRDPIVLDDLPRFVRTRGSVYCLLPSLSGLAHLAAMGAGTP